MIKMTDCQMNKAKWVKDHLVPFFQSVGCGIVDIDYSVTDSGLEILDVFYDEDRICSKKVNVTADSLAAIVKDMYRQDAIY